VNAGAGFAARDGDVSGGAVVGLMVGEVAVVEFVGALAVGEAGVEAVGSLAVVVNSVCIRARTCAASAVRPIESRSRASWPYIAWWKRAAATERIVSTKRATAWSG
jgi:hypothetical protein